MIFPFGHKYKGNSMWPKQGFAWTMAAETHTSSQHYFSIWVSDLFRPALGTLSLWGSHPWMLRTHSSHPERFLDRSTSYPPVPVRTLFRGRDEEMRQKAAESTDAHISSARSREWFISFYHKSQVFLQGFALDFQSVLMAVKNHIPKQIQTTWWKSLPFLYLPHLIDFLITGEFAASHI